MINENFNIESTSLTTELKANFSEIISLLGENTE